MNLNSLSRIYFLFVVIILLSSSTTGVTGLKSDNSVYLNDNQVQIDLSPDETNLFEEDFSDYSIHNWDMSGGSSFTSDADPAYATAGETTISNIETTDVGNFADEENITIYFRIKTNSSLSYLQSGGIYFSDGANTYNFKIGASSYNTSLFYLDDTTQMIYEKKSYDWIANTWHWLRMNTYRDGTNRVIEFLSVLNADTDIPNSWDGDVLSTLSVTWSSITALGLNIRHNEDSADITSWEFDDIIVSTIYPGTVNIVVDPIQGDFVEDFSDYTIHNWDMSNGSNFISNADPATVSDGSEIFSSIHTTDLGDLSNHGNLTMCIRLKTSSDDIYSRHGGFYFSDGVHNYYYSIGVGSSGPYLRHYIDSTGNNDDLFSTTWNEATWQWLRIETYYDDTNRILKFSYAIDADLALPTEWVSGGLSVLTVEWNAIGSLGVFMSHNFQSEAISEWQFDDIVINKGTAIDVPDVPDVPSEPEYEYSLSDVGLDIYKLSDVKDQTLELTLDAADSDVNLMIVDTNFGYSVLSGFLFDNDPVYNPHNLVDTFYEYDKEITYLNIEFDDLWVVVYSIDYLVGNYIDREYNFTSSANFVLDDLDVDLSSNLPFSQTGVITENGDEYWDTTEAVFIPFSLSAGEILDFHLELSSGNLLILLFDGDTTQDIENTLSAIINAIDYGGSLPYGVYIFANTVEGFLYFSYAPTSSISGNIAIFSYDGYNPSSMSFTLLTSIELGEAIYKHVTNPTSSGTVPFPISYLIVLPVLTIIYSRKKSNN